MDEKTPNRPHADLREAICNRASEIQLGLLDWIKREIDAGNIPSAHLEAYETLCRAETARRG